MGLEAGGARRLKSAIGGAGCAVLGQCVGVQAGQWGGS